MFKRSPKEVPQPAREPHPDPAVEVRLQHLIGLIRLRKTCHDMIGTYRAEIESAHAGMSDAVRQVNLRYTTRDDLQVVKSVAAERIALAESGVEAQQDRAEKLGKQLLAAVDELGLSAVDLAYLPSLDS